MTTAREETTRLAELLRREHHALAEFLVALATFDREKRWVELGHASLFSFLRRELGLSAGAAQYRKTAAALVQEYPQVEAALRDGRLCLSTVIELAKVMTPENTAEILPRFFGLSARDAAFVATSIRPVEKPPVRAFLVTPLRLDRAAEAVPTDAPPPGMGAAESALAFRTSETAPAGMVAAVPVHTSAVRDRPSVRPLDGERARVNMTVSRRLLEKLAAARDALSHSHPGASEEQILEVGLDLILQRHARRRGLVEKPRKTAPATRMDASAVVDPADARSSPRAAARGRSRYVPAEIRRAVWKRDGGRCAWPLEGGGVCGSTHQVELDHVDGFALGGATSVERCRLLCRAHQDVHAVQAGTWVTFWTGHTGDTSLRLPAGGRGQSPCDGSSSLCC